MRVPIMIIAAVLCACGKDKAKEPPKPLLPAPTVSQIQPPEATPRGLRIGQVIGDGFDTSRAVTVYFGDKKSPRAAIVAKTKIQVEVPPGANGSSVDVRVEIEGHQPVVLPMQFRYRERAEPVAVPEALQAP